MKRTQGKALGVLWLLTVFTGAAAAAADGPGQVTLGAARFTVITPECIRLEYQKDGHFIDDPSLFAVERTRRFAGAVISKNGSGLDIDTGRIHLSYQPDGREFHAGNLHAVIQSSQGSVEWNPGKENAGNLGGTATRLDEIDGPVPIEPGLLSRDGWFLLDDSAKPLLVNDGHGDAEDERWVSDRPKGSGKDWYLFGYGDDFAAGLRAMTAIGGSIPIPRRYLFGTWYSRWWPYSSTDYREIVQEFHQHDFPLDMLVFDMGWHIPGWTGLSWNRALLPDAEALVQELLGEQIHVTLNDHPAGGMSPAEDMYAAFMEAMGENPASHKTIRYDAGNRKYLDTLFEYGQSAREREGVDFWWMDWWGDHLKFDRLDWLNEYYFRHSRENGKRGQSFARWGGWGDQRHAIQFSGDVQSTWVVLGFEVPFTSTAGNMGAFYWSHDIGGFRAPGLFGETHGASSGELVARWTQFGALSPILRLHSTRSPEFDKRPWKWAPDVEESMRRSFHLRATLLPYVYSTAWEAHHDSMPLVRPLYLAHGKESKAFENPQEYEFGDSLLVAPVSQPGEGNAKMATQAVWFPTTDDGSRWYHWFSGERYDGGTDALVSSDFNEMPLFARGGVPIVLQPYSERPGSDEGSALVIRAYPGSSGQEKSSTLYEDDGVSAKYEDASARIPTTHALTPVSYQRTGDSVSIAVSPTEGSFDGQLANRAYTIEFAETQAASGAWLNGDSIAVAYDPAARVNRVSIPARSIRQGFTVTIAAADADSGAVAQQALAQRIGEVTGVAPPANPEAWLANYVAAYRGEVKGPARALFGLAGIGLANRAGGLEVFAQGMASHVELDNRGRALFSADCSGSPCGYSPPRGTDGTISQAYVDFGKFWIEEDLAPPLMR